MAHSGVDDSAGLVPGSSEASLFPLSVALWLPLAPALGSASVEVGDGRLLVVLDVRVKAGVLGLGVGTEFFYLVNIGRVIRSPFSVGARDLDVIDLRSEPSTSVLNLR